MVALSTWFIPSVSYDYVDGVPLAVTYHATQANPQGIGDILKAAFSGFYDAVDVCVFILMVGGFLGVVMKTGAIDAGVSNVIALLGGREKWLIPILMLFFGLGGTTYGMWEEPMAFYPLLIPVFLAAGYDAVVGISVILLGAGAGVIASTVVYGGIMNPASAILYQPNLSLSVLKAYYLTGFPFDLVHAAATALFLWFGAEPMLEKLERVKRKYGLTEAE